MNNDLVIISKAAIEKIINQLSNFNYAWHLIDALRELLNKAQVVDGKSIATMHKDGSKLNYSAIWKDIQALNNGDYKLYLTPQPQPAIPEWFVLAPIEPTEEMLLSVDEEVGGHCHSCTKWKASHDDCRAIYKALIESIKKNGI